MRWASAPLAAVVAAFLSPGATLAKSGKGTQPLGGGPPPAPLAPLNAASHQAIDIVHLFWIIFALSAVVFVLIVIALAINIVKFSHRPGDDDEPEQIYGNRRIEVLWTLIPAVILLVSFIATVIVMVQVDTTNASSGDRVNINAIGHQWWWEFQYPGHTFAACTSKNAVVCRVKTANELHVPLGKTIVVHISSVDVLHSFWVPQLGRQMEAIPNQTKIVYITPDRTGIFPGACYEFCGDGHAWMQFRMVVQKPAVYARWLKHEEGGPTVTSSSAAQAGAHLFTTLTCASCHTVAGMTSGVFGPNLTHVASRWGIAGGVLPMSKANLARWISNPNTYKEGALMPSFQGLRKKKINQLATFLWGLK